MGKPLCPQLRLTAAPSGTGFHVIEWSGAPVRADTYSIDGLTHTSGVTATTIAWCAQVDRARHASWATGGCLKQKPPFNERDAMEAAIAFSLARGGVSQKVARAAWKLIRPDVKRLLMAGERDIWAVVGSNGHRAWALATAEEAADRASGEGLCWTVATGDALKEAVRRYNEATRHGMPSHEGVAHLSALPSTHRNRV